MRKLVILVLVLLPMIALGQDQTCDEFNGSSINTTIWNPLSGTWTLSNGRIKGYWDLGWAHGEQANLILTDAAQPTGDYTFEADLVSLALPYTSGHRIVLYQTAGNKYNIAIHDQSKTYLVEVKVNSGNYQMLIPSTAIPNLDNTANAINHVKVVRGGNHFAMYVNDVYLFTLTDTRWNGEVKIGIGAYGDATYERACITAGGQPPVVGKRILVYSTRNMYGNAILASDFDTDLPAILAEDGFAVTVTDRGAMATLTAATLSEYDQLWFISGLNTAILSQSEVQAILDFQAAGKALMVISDGCWYSVPANQFSPTLGVTYSSARCCDCDHCGGAVGCNIPTSGFPSHEIWNGVTSIQANLNEGDLAASASAQIIATHNGTNMVAVRDGSGGRVAWDATIYRFQDAGVHPDASIMQADNTQYVKNLANWLSGSSQPQVWLINPAENLNTGSTGSVTFNWGSSDASYTYFIEFSESPEITSDCSRPPGVFSKPLGGTRTSDLSWASSPGYFPQGEFYWHVGAYKNGVLVMFTPPRKFLVLGSVVSALQVVDPQVTGDFLDFAIRAMDALGQAVPEAIVFCDDPIGSKCMQGSTNIDGYVHFSLGPLSSGKLGLLTVTFLSGGARAVYTITSLLPDANSIHPTPQEFEALIQADPVLSERIAGAGFDPQNALVFSSTPKALQVPAFGSPAASVVFDQYDDLGRYVASRSVGMDEFAYLNAGSRTLLDWEYEATTIGNSGLERKAIAYTLPRLAEEALPFAEVVSFTILSALCVAGAPETGLASCIPLALYVQKKAAWQMINEQVAEGNIDQSTVTLLKQLEAAEAFIEIVAVATNSLENNVIAPEGFHGEYVHGQYIDKYAFLALKQSPGEYQWVRGWEDLSETNQKLQMLGWGRSLISNGATFTSVLTYNPPNNGGILGEAKGNFSDGTEFTEYFGVGDYTRIEILGKCPFTMRIVDSGSRETGWSKLGKKAKQDIPLSFYGGPQIDPQRITILQPNGEYLLSLEGTAAGIADIEMRAYIRDSLIDTQHFMSLIHEGEEIGIPIFVSYTDGRINAVLASGPFSLLSGFVKKDNAIRLPGVLLSIFDSNGNLWKTVMTDDTGYYHIDSIPNGDYTIKINTPLGYATDQEIVAFTVNHVPVAVNFNLVRNASDKIRNIWWWKGQLQSIKDGKPSVVSKADINKFGEAIFKHYYQRVDEYAIKIENTTFMAGPRAINYDDLYQLFLGPLENTDYARAGRALLTNMLNVASGAQGQASIVSSDGASAAQAIIYFADRIQNGTLADHYTAYINLRRMHMGEKIPAGVIPMATPNIMFKNEEVKTSIVPSEFALYQNYPNPFNPTTEISFSLPVRAEVTLDIFNIAGQKVATLVDGTLEAGEHTVQWDSRDNNGLSSASGIYLYRIQAGDFTDTKKMVLLK